MEPLSNIGQAVGIVASVLAVVAAGAAAIRWTRDRKLRLELEIQLHRLERLCFRVGALVANRARKAARTAYVDDIVATKAELESKGVMFLSDVNVVDEGVLAGWRWVYFHDPDRIPVELVQVAYYNEEERETGIAEYLANRPSLESLGGL